MYSCKYHVIFCPRYRHKIFSELVRQRFIALCIEIGEKYCFAVEDIETDRDHAHMIISCNPRYGIMKCIACIKTVTGFRLLLEFPELRRRYFWRGGIWSRSTFIATVGSVSLGVVKAYIENQGKA